MEKQQISKSFTYIPTEEEKNKDREKQQDLPDTPQPQLLNHKLKWTAITLAILSVVLYSIGAFIQIHFRKDSKALYIIATICLIPIIYCFAKLCKVRRDL